MGQTLTHGVYLPDEGERNCYNGLAGNWQLLDGAVGTIAAHTAALAGKAPLVHTHTKENVTDLLNSNFIPSANNSYDLGSSGKQWNNLYAKNYYYNGVAWGLDQNNTWTGANTFQDNLYHKSSSSALVKGTIPPSVTYYGSFRHQTYTGDEINLFRGYIGTTGDNCYRWAVAPWVSGSNGRFQMRVSSDGSVRAFEVDGTEVSPYTDNATDLGTSTNKWKTLNGINPGALSLPSKSVESINDRIYNPDGQLNAIDLNGGANYWTSDCDCYIYFFTKNDRFSWIQIYWPNTGVCLGQTYTPVPNETSDYSGYIPVPAGTKVIIKIKGTHTPTFRRIPCQGNV